MADYIVTQNDIALLKQKNKICYAKIELLNKNLIPINNITGSIISGNYSFDADSNLRRTSSLVINLTSSKITIDEHLLHTSFLKIYVGFYSYGENNIIYYNEGIYLFDSLNFNYNVTTNTLTLSNIDYMGNYDIEHNGSIVNGNGLIASSLLTIPAGSNIRNALISAIIEFGITDYNIDEMGTYYDTTLNENNTVPYDIEFKAGDSLLDLIVKLRDLYPSWEAFFDKDGVFVCRLIPTLEEDDCVISAQLMEDLIIDESVSSNLSDIKNIVNLWGKELEVDRYTDVVSSVSNSNITTYNVILETFSETDYVDGMTIGIKIDQSTTGTKTYININSLGSIQVIDYMNQSDISTDSFKADEIYLFKYSLPINKFYYAGQYQVHALAYLTAYDPLSNAEGQRTLSRIKEKYKCNNIIYTVNPDSPYCVEYIGDKITTCSGDDYDNIYYDSLALSNADYELWKTSRLNDNITLEMIYIPWLDVNMKIEYRKQNETESHQYIIKSINADIGFCTMTVTMMRFYNLYKNTDK